MKLSKIFQKFFGKKASYDFGAPLPSDTQIKVDMAFKQNNYKMFNGSKFRYIDDKYQDLKYREVFEVRGRETCDILIEANNLFTQIE